MIDAVFARLIARVILAGVVTSAAGIRSQDRPGSTLPYAEAARLPSLKTEADERWPVDTGTRSGTNLEIPHGPTVRLLGSWTRRATMWDDSALVFREDRGDLFVLDGKAAKARLVWENPHRAWAPTPGAGFSSDGSTLFAWLDFEQQLVALDVASGEMRSLTALDSHIWNYKGDRHLDPRPVRRQGGPVENAKEGLLLFLLYEESNAHVAPWQRQAGRGGCWLASLDLEGGSPVLLFEKVVLPQFIVAWDLSLKRARLYTLGCGRTNYGYRPEDPRQLEERRLNGQLVRSWPEPEGGIGAIQLSPDEKLLLLERSFKPGMPIPSIPLDDWQREHHRMYDAAEDGGFVLLDLDSEALIDGPDEGSEARWAPDGDRIVYADGFSVRLASVSTRRSSTLIQGPPTGEWAWPPWCDFVWSPNGERLAMTVGGRDLALLIDLGTSEYVIVRQEAVDKCWAPVPRPFGPR